MKTFSVSYSVTEDTEPLRTELAELRASINDLKMEMKRLAETQTFVTFIASLGDPEITLSRPIPVTIQREDDGFIASFFDAGISTGGVNEQDAISNLQSLILDFFEMQEDGDEEDLEPVMKQQRAALLDVVCRNSQNLMPKKQPKSSKARVATA